MKTMKTTSAILLFCILNVSFIPGQSQNVDMHNQVKQKMSDPKTNPKIRLYAYSDDGINYGFKNPVTKEIAIPATYQYTRTFSEGLGCVKLNNKWGFIDNAGTVIIPVNIALHTHFKTGLLPYN
jgi:hypothetical protein